MKMKQVNIKDFLTDEEIQKAIAIIQSNPPDLRTTRRIEEEIIKPNLSRINKALGQENDAMYLAYAIDYAIDFVLRRVNNNDEGKH